MARSGFFLLLLFAPALTAAEQPKRFFCGYYLIESGKKASNYFDRVFVLEKSDESEPPVYTGNFPLQNISPFEMRQKAGFFVGFFQTFKGALKDVYRETYTIYRMSLETGVLIESMAYYASAEDYKNYFLPMREENPYSPPYSPEVPEFIDKKLPKGFVKFGWDTSLWRCRDISYPKYLLRSFQELLYQFLGA